MTLILQKHIPYAPLAEVPLPGIQPLEMDRWLMADDAYAGQMAERERLLADRRADVLAQEEAARPAVEELLDTVLGLLADRADYGMQGDVVRCPDGRLVTVDRADPLATVARLVQEDMCLLQKRGDEHVLTAAVLCFPASWSLEEKFGRPLVGIHTPVESYDANIARRVQRLFDGVRPGRPLWRKNALWYNDAQLFQPRRENARRDPVDQAAARYLRSERQSILRLPGTDAVVFSIHTFVMARDDVPDQATG